MYFIYKFLTVATYRPMPSSWKEKSKYQPSEKTADRTLKFVAFDRTSDLSALACNVYYTTVTSHQTNFNNLTVIYFTLHESRYAMSLDFKKSTQKQG